MLGVSYCVLGIINHDLGNGLKRKMSDVSKITFEYLPESIVV